MVKEKGFTLIELLVVLVIIGILVAVAVPIYGSVTNSAERTAVEANLRTIDGAIMMYYADRGQQPDDFSEDLAGIFFEDIKPVAGEGYDIAERNGQLRSIVVPSETQALGGYEAGAFSPVNDFLGRLPWDEED